MINEEENKMISDKMIHDDGHALVCVIGNLNQDNMKAVK